jgi:hypothetical protein
MAFMLIDDFPFEELICNDPSVDGRDIERTTREISSLNENQEHFLCRIFNFCLSA